VGHGTDVRGRGEPVGWLLMLCLFTVAPTCADTRIEQLVMPGPLTQSHAKYENRCEECHQLLSKKAQTSLCRRCHEEIDDDIRARTGFHGRIKGIEDMECRRCHTDHAGRDADIVAFDEGSFEHDQTDFTLEGAHRRATCGACHEKDKALRDTPHDCHACHRDDDAHREKLGRKCEDCHDASNWQSAREDFDHEKTHFPLHGEHEKAAIHRNGIVTSRASVMPAMRSTTSTADATAPVATSAIRNRTGRSRTSTTRETPVLRSKDDTRM
jgi:hypothetical protein